MAAIPLLIYAPILAVIFYAILGFLFGGYAEKKTYCMVIATHQVMGLRYSSIYEIILISIAVSALGTGVLVAIGAVPVIDAYAFLPGAGWFTLLSILWVSLTLRKRRLASAGKSVASGSKAILNSPYFIGTVFSLAMIASFIFAAGHSFNYLGVTTPVALFSQYLLSPFGLYLGGSGVSNNWYQTIPVISAFSFFILMIIAGSAIFSMARGTFKIRLPSGSASKIGDLSIGFAGGIIIAIGARIAQGCSVGGFWSGLAGLSLFGLVFTVGIILGSIAGYFVYIFLSSAFASKEKKTKTQGKKSKAHSGLIEQSAFSVIFGLILVAIGLESISANSKYLIKVASPLITQEGEVMVIAGIIVMALGLAITIYHYFRDMNKKIAHPNQ